MAPFEPPECEADHSPAEMSFLEAFDPLDGGSCGVGSDCTEWQKRWRYACPECGRVVEMRETLDGYEEMTVRDSTGTGGRDSTALNPLKE